MSVLRSHGWLFLNNDYYKWSFSKYMASCVFFVYSCVTFHLYDKIKWRFKWHILEPKRWCQFFNPYSVFLMNFSPFYGDYETWCLNGLNRSLCGFSAFQTELCILFRREKTCDKPQFRHYHTVSFLVFNL